MFVRIHIVQKGETLWRIAKQYGIGLDELKRLNAHLANPDYIVPEWKLFYRIMVQMPIQMQTQIVMNRQE